MVENFSITDIGNYRQTNEDYLYKNGKLFIVADGMGGHNAGEVASSQATETFKNFFYKYIQQQNDPDTGEIERITRLSIESANSKVYRNSVSSPSLSGMGTTLTSCYISGKDAIVGHVGDSRLYLKRGKELTAKTRDHTLVGELYRNGKISQEQAFSHPQKNILTNVIGTTESIDSDIFTFELEPEDILLLCTDGLNSMLTDKLINKIMEKSNNLNDMSNNLVRYAKQKGGLDNITLILIKYEK
ncbi:MAG: Stp1/IreP family PP2C-type Ser/Thr phosphatase [Actinomycetota bacterium]